MCGYGCNNIRADCKENGVKSVLQPALQRSKPLMQRAGRSRAVRRCKPACQTARNHYRTVFAVKYMKLKGKMERHIARCENVSGKSLKMNAAFDQH